jgi:hypothetical protein
VDEAEGGSAGMIGAVDRARNARHRKLPAWSMGMSHTGLTNVRLTPLAAQGMPASKNIANYEVTLSLMHLQSAHLRIVLLLDSLPTEPEVKQQMRTA